MNCELWRQDKKSTKPNRIIITRMFCWCIMKEFHHILVILTEFSATQQPPALCKGFNFYYLLHFSWHLEPIMRSLMFIESCITRTSWEKYHLRDMRELERDQTEAPSGGQSLVFIIILLWNYKLSNPSPVPGLSVNLESTNIKIIICLISLHMTLWWLNLVREYNGLPISPQLK